MLATMTQTSIAAAAQPPRAARSQPSRKYVSLERRRVNDVAHFDISFAWRFFRPFGLGFCEE